VFRNGYLASLLESSKSVRSGVHIGGNLYLVNESHRSHISATASINNKLTHFAFNGTLSVEDLLPLTRFNGNLLGMEGSSNHE